MKYLIFLIVTSALFISCTKGSDNNNVTMTYGQTQCSDKWGYGANDDETKTKLTQFLDSLRISYTDVKFAKTNPAAVCLACICVTGGVFTLKTTEAYVNQLKDLGFTRQ
jgi:hypothetical protein